MGNHAVLLRERMRVGAITRSHVELAARLGHQAVRELMPDVELIDLANPTERLRELIADGKLTDQEEDVLCAAFAHACRLMGDRTLTIRMVTEWADQVLPMCGIIVSTR